MFQRTIFCKCILDIMSISQPLGPRSCTKVSIAIQQCLQRYRIKEFTRAGNYKWTWIKLRSSGEQDYTNPTEADASGFNLLR